jgi:hypothetical protein
VISRVDPMKILILSLVLLLQQKDDAASVWRSVGAYQGVTSRDDRDLSDTQVAAIRKKLKSDKEVVACGDFESADSVLERLEFQRVWLSSDNTQQVLVEAGPGCRGGANGPMWIVQLNRGRVTVLASPAGGFEGYVYSVPITTSRGYRDIVVGWHDSASEAGLAYFRFDGTQYRKLSRVTARMDDNGKETLVLAK